MTTFIRSVHATVLFALFISAGSLVAAGAGSKGTTEGTFVGIEQGDPAQFVIKEKGGGQHSFFIPRAPDESVQPYLDKPAKFKGRPVKVYWHKRVVADGLTTFVVKVE
jgi:hypothetical protein